MQNDSKPAVEHFCCFYFIWPEANDTNLFFQSITTFIKFYFHIFYGIYCIIVRPIVHFSLRSILRWAFFKVKTVCFSFTTFLTLWRYFFCEIIWINWVVTAYVHSWWGQTMKKKHTTSNNLHNFDSRRDEMNNCEVDVDDVEAELTTQRNSRKKGWLKC